MDHREITEELTLSSVTSCASFANYWFYMRSSVVIIEYEPTAQCEPLGMSPLLSISPP